jgi:hypothetical protein
MTPGQTTSAASRAPTRRRLLASPPTVSSLVSFGGFLHSFYASEASSVECLKIFLFAVLKKRKVEAHRDFILGPVSPKEYKDTVAELNGSRTNRVFEFFKIIPPERVGFAKHREAAERRLPRLRPPKGTSTRRRLRRAPLRGRPARGAPPLRPLPPPKGGPGRNVVGSWRTLPRHPRGPESSTSRPASLRT